MEDILKSEEFETEEVVLKKTQQISNGNGDNVCHLYYYHVQVKNIKQKASEMMIRFLDESWLSKIDDEGDRESFKVRAEPTIKALIKILKKVGSKIGGDFGEYLVSTSALTTLENECGHEALQLAEIWKEQESKNPGFDFHTLSSENILLFGEAKYRANKNAYGSAIKGICKFIKKKKDIAELVDLKRLHSNRINNEHLNENKKGFIASFSIHNNFENIFKTIIDNKDINENKLFKYAELYFIGIELCQ